MKINTAHTRKKMFVYRNGELNPALTFIRHGKGYKGYGHSFKSYDSAVEWAATAGRAFMTSQDTLQTE